MEEDDFEYGSRKDRSARQGRRARKADLSSEVDQSIDALGDDLSVPNSKPAGRDSAKQGRRSKKTDSNFEVDHSIDALDDDLPAQNSKPATRDRDGPPRPSRRMGGWGEEKRKTQEELDDQRLTGGMNKDDESDDEPDIPVIPDLEDAQEEDLTAQVAMAPNVVVNRVATYRELDNDLLRHAQFLTLDNEIDLKLLAKCLSAEQDIIEEDTPWEWERLFTEVSSELLTEWEKAEVKEETEAAA